VFDVLYSKLQPSLGVAQSRMTATFTLEVTQDGRQSINETTAKQPEMHHWRIFLIEGGQQIPVT
jgi:hypothetical protein